VRQTVKERTMSGTNADRRDEALDDLLDEGLRSETWREWRQALEKRLAELRADQADHEDPSEVDARIHELEAQIDALGVEEIITEFVESQVDLVLNSAEEDEIGF
jgi:hypothetical protein